MNENEIVKTSYMERPVKGYSEYFFKTDEARDSVIPRPGDRALMKNGDVYFCWEKGVWEKIGE